MNNRKEINKLLSGVDSTLIFLLIGCSFITIWLAGAGWIDISRIKELANMVIGLGIGAGGFSLARSFRDVSKTADAKTETVRAEMQNYYRTLLDDLVKSGAVTLEELRQAEATRQAQNGKSTG